MKTIGRKTMSELKNNCVPLCHLDGDSNHLNQTQTSERHSWMASRTTTTMKNKTETKTM